MGINSHRWTASFFQSFVLALWLAFSAAPATAGDDPEAGAKKKEAKTTANAKAENPNRLRLMTYNIHHGEGTDGKFDLVRQAEILKGWRADMVAVQEVDVKTRRASGVDQAAELSKLTGMHYAFGKFMDYDGGEYGQMVLSKFPIKRARNLALPPGPEPRTALVVDVKLPDGSPLVFVGLHFYATEKQRSAQAKRLMELLAPEIKAGTPIVLAGDFNSTPGSKPMEMLLEKWTDPTVNKNVRTWPSGMPRVKIDHILLFPESRFKFVKSKVLREKVASDHRPVATVLDLLPENLKPEKPEKPAEKKE